MPRSNSPGLASVRIVAHESPAPAVALANSALAAPNEPGVLAAEPAQRLGGAAYPRPGLAPVSYRAHYYPHATDDAWDDWKWQYRNRITTLAELDAFLPLAPQTRVQLGAVLREFRMGIPPYYLSLIDPHDALDPMRLQAVPSISEFLDIELGSDDPLAEEANSPVPGIVHRYPDRCLLVATNNCALYCRYCTRKRIMEEDMAPAARQALDRMIDYIAQTPTVRDVVVSGGDPLTWGTARLVELLDRLSAIGHLEVIRIGSRVPVTLPQRITPELCAALERYSALWINTHFNHPREVTREAAAACARLLRAGIPLNNQSVLLRGVNDDVLTMRALVHALLRIRVRPYYLYHCDPVRGSQHLRTSVARGLEIIEGLRGHTSGLAIPTYVIDAPGGGKIPIQPQYLQSYANGRATLRNYQGRVFEYDDPEPG